jgi:hypothetical protein
MNVAVVLPQQIFTIVVSIGRPYHRVNVTLGGFLISEPNTGVMIKFGHQNGALDSIIERVFVAVASDPAPPSTIQRRFYSRQFCC